MQSDIVMHKFNMTFIARLTAVIFLSLFVFSPKARANDNPDGLVLQKTINPTPDADGNYWLTLDAYVTGSIEVVTTVEPLDVVLVLDTSESLKESGLSALKTAVSKFLDQLAAYDKEGNTANVGVVHFNTKAHKITDGIVPVKDNIETIKADINGIELNWFSSTNVKAGMEIGCGWIKDLPASTERKRVLVLFTDGEPGAMGGDLDQAKSVLNSAKEIKGFCSVYTVGMISSSTESSYIGQDSMSPSAYPKLTVKEYLERCSSNYPQAYFTWSSSGVNKYNWNSPKADELKYYTRIAQSDLSSIFEAISKEITNLPTIDVTEKTVIKDGIAKEFQLPEGFVASGIQTYTAAYAGVDGSGNPLWGALTTFAANKQISSDRATVTVTNFNFQDNWCGDNKGVNHGSKLVIKFPIVPKATTIGGVDVPTNTPDSGMYLDGEPVGHFPIPDIDLPKKLIIRKVGLNAGESAIFKVNQIKADRSSVELFTLMLTGIEGQSYVEKTIDNLAPEFDYNVTETDWSWSYTPSGSTSITTSSDSANPLVFTNVKNNNAVKNAEAMVENKFETIRVTP